MIQSIIVATRDRERLAEVLAVAAQFGLDGLLTRLGVKRGEDVAALPDLPIRTRLALEALGPTYIKLGQILATRRDLLNDKWIQALEHLQSSAPSLPFEDLQEQIETSLGETVTTAFAEFDRTARAAASIAQGHRATLHDGEGPPTRHQAKDGGRFAPHPPHRHADGSEQRGCPPVQAERSGRSACTGHP